MAKKTGTTQKNPTPVAEPEHLRHGLPLLQLLASQLEAAIVDNNHAMAELTDAYSNIAATLQPMIEKKLKNPAQQEQLHNEMNRMIVAFQGHDAFNQRMEHLSSALGTLSHQLADRAQRDKADCWKQLTTQLSASYTTTEERSIFEQATRSRDSKRETVCRSPDAEGGSIELF